MYKCESLVAWSRKMAEGRERNELFGFQDWWELAKGEEAWPGQEEKAEESGALATRSKFTEVGIPVTSTSPGNVLNKTSPVLLQDSLRVPGTESHSRGHDGDPAAQWPPKSESSFIYCACKNPQARWLGGVGM